MWLLADADDWPLRMYVALGFERAGFSWQFTKIPPARAARLHDPGTSGA